VAAVDEQHYLLLSDLITAGEVVPFLGSGANLCDRPDEEPWEPGRWLPNGAELAQALAERSRYPAQDSHDLLRVSQYVDAILGEKQLYRYLRAIFDVDYPPNSLHSFLATLPALLRERGSPQMLVITTNYDDLLERALDERGEAYDLVWYEAKHGSLGGKFLHRAPAGKPVAIERPNKYTKLSLNERMVILKLHGAVDRLDEKGDSYVITEDNYIDYLSLGDIGGQIPVTLRERMADSHFLFLGYSMRDWNLRVILNRIWGAQELDLKSWAIQREPEDLAAKKIEETLWRARGDVDLLYVPLREYVAQLSTQVLGAATERVGP
jgi:SIR2-like protein